MKILYIAHTVGAGGSSIALINILKGVSKYKDVEVAVVCPEKKGCLIDQLEKLGIKIYTSKSASRSYVGFNVFPKTKGLWSTIHAWMGFLYRYINGFCLLSKVVDDFKPDLIHTNSGVCDIGYRISKAKKIKHIWHIREFIDKGLGLTSFPSNKRQFEKLHSKHNYNIAITEAVFNHYELRTRDIQIYDGVIDSNIQINTAVRKQYKFPYFLFVGNISEAKGVDVLITQFAELRNVTNIPHLLIAGPYESNMPYYNFCNKIIQDKNLGSCIHWLGKRNDVYELMSHAIALVVPSRYEGFGFITVEAMFNDCLVIGRDTAGTKEQFNKGLRENQNEIGLRFVDDEELPQLMYNAMHEDFTLMKKQAKDTVLRNYTIEACAQQIYTFYKKILSEKV